MQFSEDQPQATYLIQAYDRGWVQIQNQRLTQPFIVSGQTLISDWVTGSFEELSPEQLDPLFALKPELDNFFDNVFVNHEDEKIKTNRKNLIGLVYQGFRKIADIKEITI